MGIFKKIKEKLFEEKQGQEKVIEEKAQDYSSALVDNKIICNKCGEEIEGKPRFINHAGRRLMFHKRCLKHLSMGNL